MYDCSLVFVMLQWKFIYQFFFSCSAFGGVKSATDKKRVLLASYMWIWNKSQIINYIIFVENRKIQRKNCNRDSDTHTHTHEQDREMKKEKKNIQKMYQNNLLLTAYRLLHITICFGVIFEFVNEFDVNALIKHSTWKRTAWQYLKRRWVCVMYICEVFCVRCA